MPCVQIYALFAWQFLLPSALVPMPYSVEEISLTSRISGAIMGYSIMGVSLFHSRSVWAQEIPDLA